MYKVTIVAVTVVLSLLLIPVHATANFSYELWMQSETSLDMGPIEVQGKIVNIGSYALALPPQWGALWGIPSNLSSTTCGLECVNNQLSQYSILSPGQGIDFLWLSGTQEESLSGWKGDLLEGSLGLIPYNSDWNWTSGGAIPELSVSSTFVNGDAVQGSWNITTINMDNAGSYLNTPTMPVAPEPISSILFFIGGATLGFKRFRNQVDLGKTK